MVKILVTNFSSTTWAKQSDVIFGHHLDTDELKHVSICGTPTFCFQILCITSGGMLSMTVHAFLLPVYHILYCKSKVKQVIYLYESIVYQIQFIYIILNIIILYSTCFLMGPLNQLKKMFAKTRIIATILVLVGHLHCWQDINFLISDFFSFIFTYM